MDKTLKMLGMEPTGLRRSARLANKPKQKYGLFAKLSLELIVSCEVDNNPTYFQLDQTKITRKLIYTLMGP